MGAVESPVGCPAFLAAALLAASIWACSMNGFDVYATVILERERRLDTFIFLNIE